MFWACLFFLLSNVFNIPILGIQSEFNIVSWYVAFLNHMYIYAWQYTMEYPLSQKWIFTQYSIDPYNDSLLQYHK